MSYSINKTENKTDIKMEISTARCVALNPSNGVEIAMYELESDELSQKVDVEKIKADINNKTVAVIDKNKEITFKATEVVSREDLELMKLQAIKKTGEIEVWHMPELYDVTKSTDGKYILTLPELPVDETQVTIYTTKDILIPKENYTLVDKVVTFDETKMNLKEGDTLRVTSYQYKKKVKYADIGIDVVPSTVTLIINKPVFNADGLIVEYKQYFMPKVKVDSNITLSGSTEKSKQTVETNFEVISDPAYKYLVRIAWIETEEGRKANKTIDKVVDLNAVAGDSKATLTFTYPEGAKNIKVQYKLDTDDTYTDAPVEVTEGNVELGGLTNASDYDVRLKYDADEFVYYSNVVSVTPTV